MRAWWWAGQMASHEALACTRWWCAWECARAPRTARVRDTEPLPSTHDGGLHEEGSAGGGRPRVEPQPGEVRAQTAGLLVLAREELMQGVAGRRRRPPTPQAEDRGAEQEAAEPRGQDRGGGEQTEPHRHPVGELEVPLDRGCVRRESAAELGLELHVGDDGERSLAGWSLAELDVVGGAVGADELVEGDRRRRAATRQLDRLRQAVAGRGSSVSRAED